MAHVDDCDILQWEIAKLEKSRAELLCFLRDLVKKQCCGDPWNYVEEAERLLAKYGGENG